MSTRSNIVIKNEETAIQLYHHHDGYPEGVGNDLKEYMREIAALPEEETKKLLSNPDLLAKWLSADEREDEYEDEGEATKNSLHGDIEYLYVIDLTTKTITCYKVWLWDSQYSDLDVIEGDIDDKEKQFFVYRVNLTEEWNGKVGYGEPIEKSLERLQAKYDALKKAYNELKEHYETARSNVKDICIAVSDLDSDLCLFDADALDDEE